MATVTRREWTTKTGVAKTAWKVDYKDAAGVRRAKQFARKKDAEGFLDQVRDEIRRGSHVADRATVTFGEACQAWLDHCERRWQTVNPDGSRGLAGGTLNLYRGTAARSVLPTFGRVKLTEISS